MNCIFEDCIAEIMKSLCNTACRTFGITIDHFPALGAKCLGSIIVNNIKLDILNVKLPCTPALLIAADQERLELTSYDMIFFQVIANFTPKRHYLLGKQ